MKKQKVIIVTGATSGIGLAIATMFLQAGNIVYGIARKKVEGLPFMLETADITNSEQIKETFNKIFEKEKRIDVLINNAGMGISGAIEHTSEQDLKNLFEVNLISQIRLCGEIIPFLRESGGGNIVNIGSLAGVIPIPFQACYSASKAAILNFSQALAMEIKPFNIFVSCVMPGDTKTGFTSARKKNKVMADLNYKNRIVRSIKKMEKDEQSGMSPQCVAKVVSSVITKKHPPLIKTVGTGNKAIVFFLKIAPTSLMIRIVSSMYAK
ncbi:MAG: SDR family oxidoreductase [Clostridia bacterium]